MYACRAQHQQQGNRRSKEQKLTVYKTVWSSCRRRRVPASGYDKRSGSVAYPVATPGSSSALGPWWSVNYSTMASLVLRAPPKPCSSATGYDTIGIRCRLTTSRVLIVLVAARDSCTGGCLLPYAWLSVRQRYAEQAAAGNSSNATLLQPNKARIRTAESAGSRTRLCEEGGRLVCNRLTLQRVPESREVCGSCRHSYWVWMKPDLEASLLIRHRLLQTW